MSTILSGNFRTLYIVLKWVEKTYINLSDNATTNMVLLFVMEIMLPKTKLMERDVRKCCFPQKVFFRQKHTYVFTYIVQLGI